MERRDGPLIWGTLRPTEAEARAMYERWNPLVEAGHAVKVELKIFDVE